MLVQVWCEKYKTRLFFWCKSGASCKNTRTKRIRKSAKSPQKLDIGYYFINFPKTNSSRKPL